jgi:hypothetical protein
MKALLVGALAATLVGCSCFVTQQAEMSDCRQADGALCFDNATAGAPVELRPLPIRASFSKKDSPSSARTGDKVVVAKARPAAARVEDPPTNQPPESSDPVIASAKAAIAAKMENPESAEFRDMKRARRKNTRGQPIDTICGYVKGKDASGEDTSERPFLYLVKEGDAYVVNGNADSVAATVYRNICNEADVRSNNPGRN